MGATTNILIPVSEKTVKLSENISKALTNYFADDFIEKSVKYEDGMSTMLAQHFDTFKYYNLEFGYNDPAFDNSRECRMLLVSKEKRSNFISISTGTWGHNEDIAKAIVDFFGGYADFNDCDGILINYCKAQ